MKTIQITDNQYKILSKIFTKENATGNGISVYEGKEYPYCYNFTKEFTEILNSFNNSENSITITTTDENLDFIIDQLKYKEIDLLKNNGNEWLSKDSLNELSFVCDTIDYFEGFLPE